MRREEGEGEERGGSGTMLTSAQCARAEQIRQRKNKKWNTGPCREDLPTSASRVVFQSLSALTHTFPNELSWAAVRGSGCRIETLFDARFRTSVVKTRRVHAVPLVIDFCVVTVLFAPRGYHSASICGMTELWDTRAKRPANPCLRDNTDARKSTVKCAARACPMRCMRCH